MLFYHFKVNVPVAAQGVRARETKIPVFTHVQGLGLLSYVCGHWYIYLTARCNGTMFLGAKIQKIRGYHASAYSTTFGKL